MENKIFRNNIRKICIKIIKRERNSMKQNLKFLIISTGIIILFGTLIVILYDEPTIRYYVGISTGLKDEPILIDDKFKLEKFVVGIKSSTALTIIDDYVIFLEKESGKVRLIDNGELLDEPLWDFQIRKEGCECYTESGLLGITHYKSKIYIYVTEEIDESKFSNNIYVFDWRNQTLQNPELLNSLPAVDNEHHGGALVSDNDGNIFAVIGDQNLESSLVNSENGENSDVGIILKVGIEEKIKKPSNSLNPDKHFHGVGIRNSFGLAIDPFTNNLWITENGTHEFDEINLALPNYNSGWVKILGPASNDELKNFKGYPGYVYSDPEFSWEKTIAPTGISFVDEKWGSYKNNVYVGDCRGNLYKFQLNDSRDELIFENQDLQDLILNDEDSSEEIIFGKNFGCITDVEYNQNDGYLYIISYLNNGAIYKIIPK